MIFNALEAGLVEELFEMGGKGLEGILEHMDAEYGRISALGL